MKSFCICTFCAVALLFFGCEEKILPSVISTVDSRTLPQQESWNSTIVVSDSGRISAIIVAGYIRVAEVKPANTNEPGCESAFLRPRRQTNLHTYK